MTFAPTPAPDDSPWGPPHASEQLLAGIWHVSTASHGGLLLSEERQAAMPAQLRVDGATYEEDIDWAAVYVAFEPEFRATTGTRTNIVLQLAHDTLRAWRPDRYGAFAGTPVEPRDSHVLRNIAAYTAAIGQYAVTCAYGDWAHWVPPGKVGVFAKKVTGVDHLGFARYDETSTVRALADASRYEQRGIVATLDWLEAVPC